MGSCCSGEVEAPMNNHAVDATHFRMLKVVGRGGFGKVNAVQHRITNNLCAMKRLKKSKLVSRKMYVATAWRERDVMSKLKSPFLVNLLHAFQDKTHLFLIMPFMQGGDLRYYLNTKGSMSEADCAFYAAEIILGLEELHHLNVVYRDLKPDNVLLDDTGHLRISDFGLAVFLRKEDNYTVTGGAGTPGYQAPEVILRQPYGRSADVWSLAITMYELLERQRPFRKPEDALRESRIEFHQKLKPETKELIRSMLIRNPERRLGCGPKGWNEIKNHSFFKGIDWGKVARREIKVPFQPDLERANCPADFELEDQFFADKKEPDLTPDQQQKFEGFEFNTAYGTASTVVSDTRGAPRLITGAPASTEEAKTGGMTPSAAAAAAAKKNNKLHPRDEKDDDEPAAPGGGAGGTGGVGAAGTGSYKLTHPPHPTVGVINTRPSVAPPHNNHAAPINRHMNTNAPGGLGTSNGSSGGSSGGGANAVLSASPQPHFLMATPATPATGTNPLVAAANGGDHFSGATVTDPRQHQNSMNASSQQQQIQMQQQQMQQQQQRQMRASSIGSNGGSPTASGTTKRQHTVTSTIATPAAVELVSQNNSGRGDGSGRDAGAPPVAVLTGTTAPTTTTATVVVTSAGSPPQGSIPHGSTDPSGIVLQTAAPVGFLPGSVSAAGSPHAAGSSDASPAPGTVLAPAVAGAA